MWVIARRKLATSAKSTKNPQFNVFDRRIKRIQRSKTPSLNPEASRKVDYIKDEIAKRTVERLAFITRDFTKTLDLGSGAGNFLNELCKTTDLPPDANEQDRYYTTQLNKDKETIRHKIKELTMVDHSEPLLFRDLDIKHDHEFPGKVSRVVADEEIFDHDALKRKDYYDVVISNLSLQWINDLPQALKNINGVLKPDGLFMGTIVGGDTLYELRTSLQLAELERKGGLSPRVSPLVHLNDVGSLLNRAGFSMLTIDSEDIVVGGFPDIVEICEQLQHSGEQNAVLSRASHLPKDVLLAANEIYRSLHGEEGVDGTITLPVTFSVIFVIGWKKSDTQPQPLARGTGQVNLKDVLGSS